MKKHFLSTRKKRQMMGNTPKFCAHCGISEADCRDFFEKNRDFTRGGHRGFSLEVDRIDSYKDYVPSNVVWACYPCNNSKSNYCNTMQEFQPIAQGIRKIWQQRGYNPK